VQPLETTIESETPLWGRAEPLSRPLSRASARERCASAPDVSETRIAAARAAEPAVEGADSETATLAG